MSTTPVDPVQALRQQLLDALNTANGTAFTFDDIAFSDPAAVSVAKYNTEITVSGMPNTNYIGIKAFHYNRIPLPKLGYFGVLSETPLDADGLLTALGALKGTTFLPVDFAELVIDPTLPDGQVQTLPLVAQSPALQWVGSTNIDYAVGISQQDADTFLTLFNQDLLSIFIN